MEYLQALFGAHSITKTVIGYYNLVDVEEDDETKLYELMNLICQNENINNDQLSLLKIIFDRIIEFRNNRDQIVTPKQLESTMQLCSNYVNWVFLSFPCFIKGENGQYYFRSN